MTSLLPSPQEGQIKFDCDWIQTPPYRGPQLDMLISWRQKLFKKYLIGTGPDEVCFGNLSIRWNEPIFMISGSQTGCLLTTSPEHYTRVTSFDLSSNHLICYGPVEASSESLTHAIFYQELPQVGAVIHVHHAKLWNRYLHKLPTSSMGVPYGTPQMALEVSRLLRESSLPKTKIMIMGGHHNGIVAFGTTLQRACNTLLEIL